MAFSNRVAGATFTKIVASVLNRVRFGIINGFSETGDSASGWSYAGTAARYANTANFKLPVSTDGYFQCSVTQNGSSPVLIAGNANNLTSYANAGSLFGIYPGTTYFVSQAGTGGITPNVVAARAYVAGDIMRLSRTGSTWTAWVSSDSGSTFTLIHTFANTSTVEVFPFIHQNTNGTGTTIFGNIIASQYAIAV